MTPRDALVHVMNLPSGFETHSSIIDYYINKIRLHHTLPENLKIVRASAKDIPAFIRVIGHTFVEYDWIWNPKVEVPDLLFDFEKRYNTEKSAFWVVKENDEVVGGIGADNPEEGVAEIHRLYLLSRVRGQKLGLKLTLTAIEWAKEKGMKKVNLLFQAHTYAPSQKTICSVFFFFFLFKCYLHLLYSLDVTI